MNQPSRLVVDASVVVAALTDNGPSGHWAAGQLGATGLMAPHHIEVEAAHALRKLEFAGALTEQEAQMAHQRLPRLSMALMPYGPIADRVWELRDNVTPYDAWYVALAEATRAPLATLDRRLAAASGPRCEFLLPPTG